SLLRFDAEAGEPARVARAAVPADLAGPTPTHLHEDRAALVEAELDPLRSPAELLRDQPPERLRAFLRACDAALADAGEVLLGLVTDTLLAAFPQAERCSVLLYDAEADRLAPRLAKARPGDPPARPPTGPALRRCLEERQALLTAEEEPAVSALTAPLVA